MELILQHDKQRQKHHCGKTNATKMAETMSKAEKM